MNQRYEIFALKYAGPLKSSGALVKWNRDWDKIVTRNYYFWLIKGIDSNETALVDVGISPDLADKLKLPNYINPVEMLLRINVEAAEVKRVILSHLQFDHDNGVGLFPNATFYVQEEEYLFWTKNPMASRPLLKAFTDESEKEYLRLVEGTPRLTLLKGDQEILPGIKCLLTPGHSIANQSVAVQTIKGTAILGVDCAHFFKNYQDDWPSIFIIDLVAWMKTYDKLRAKVSSMDLLFPGHDPAMFDNYPKVADGITKLA